MAKDLRLSFVIKDFFKCFVQGLAES